MKILILHHQMGFFGGAEDLIVRLSNYLIKNNHEVSIITLSKPPDNVKCDANFIVPEKEFSYKNWELSIGDGIELLKKVYILNKLYKEHVGDFDVVNIHNFPACWSAFPKVKPTVWMCNEPPDLWYDSDNNHRYGSRVLRNIFLALNKTMIDKSVDEICVSDEFNAKRAVERYGKPTHVINYGIDYDFYSSGSCLSYFKDNFTVLQVGVISKEKNQMETIKSVEKLRHKIPNIKLVLAGMIDNSTYSNELKSYINYKQLNNIVEIMGHQSKEIIRDLYHTCDVSVFPIKSKGGWLAPFEAMCGGRAIIVSNEMTASDIIKNNGIGIVSDDIAREILKVYRNPDGYTEMCKMGMAFVKDRLSWERYCGKMESVMKSVLSP